jgi:hypothetical protein
MLIRIIYKLMNIGKPRFFFTVLLTVCIGFLLSSCNNENTFTIGEDFIESATSMAIVDTFTVEMSTVIQDSVPTSGTDAMLMGNIEDTLFGDAGCSSFFQLGLPEGIALYEDDFYDSISLIIHYSGYFYGDTNNLMQINVHRVTDDIKVRDGGYLYNTSTFGYEDDPLGSIRFRPMPGTADSVEIKISNAFGLELFGKFVTRSEDVLSEGNFLDYFKGIALLTDASSKNAIIGFKVAPEYLKIRMYTHRIDQTSLSTAYDFPLVYPDKQFNHITYDFSNTLLHYTQDEETTIPSAAAGNKAFVQGYKKIMTRLRFPTLPDILLNNRGIIMKAELVFEPVKSSYADFTLPDFVILYETNRKNQPGALVYNADGTVQTATLVVDDQYHEETTYTFDITQFITAEMADSYFDTDHGLLISLYDETYQLNFERIVIEAKRPAPKLRLYYLTY